MEILRQALEIGNRNAVPSSLKGADTLQVSSFSRLTWVPCFSQSFDDKPSQSYETILPCEKCTQNMALYKTQYLRLKKKRLIKKFQKKFACQK